MKKKIAGLLTGIMVVSTLLTGCSSNELKTSQLTISQYTGVEVAPMEEPTEITDAHVESLLVSNLQSYAEEPEDPTAEVKLGDTASIEYVGKIDGVAFDGGSTTEPTDLTIGSHSYIDGFEASVIGHKAGETFDWNGTFPEDYQNTDLAGKDVVFTITVDGITSSVPELTDEFVQENLSDTADTVEEYEDELRARMEEQAQQMVEDTLTNAVWKKVLENTEIKEYDSEKVDEVFNTIIDTYKMSADYVGQTYEEFIEAQQGQTVEEFEADITETAKSSVKQTMVIEAIAEKEKIEPTEEEYEEQFEKMAASYGYSSVDELQSVATEDELKDVALGNIVKAWLVEHAVQTEDAEE